MKASHADAKHELLAPQTEWSTRIRGQPWYKERVQLLHHKALLKGEAKKFLVTKDWTFLKHGLDDFRNGLPPRLDDNVVLRPKDKGMGPNLRHDVRNVNQPAEPMNKRFSKEKLCYSKVLPMQDRRRADIERIESGLREHPLALHSHFEEGLPPELFEEVVDILDPSMRLRTGGGEEDGRSPSGESEAKSPSSSDGPSLEGSDKESRSPDNEEDTKSLLNAYRWVPRLVEPPAPSHSAQAKLAEHTTEEQHIKQVTRDFCDSIRGLGGDEHNIEENTIHSLFASGYETKPALNVPIHVVDIHTIPPELRLTAKVPPKAKNTKNIPENNGVEESAVNPEFQKFTYGAWYLPHRLWNKRDANVLLQDPREAHKQDVSVSKQRSLEMDAELVPMHGSKAFLEFIDRRRNKRSPEFLRRVKRLQEEAAREAAEEAEKERLREENKRERHRAAGGGGGQATGAAPGTGAPGLVGAGPAGAS